MDTFQVVDLSLDGYRVVLRDGRGALHVGRLARPSLQLHDELQGEAAKLGSQRMVLAPVGLDHSIMLEQLDCPASQAHSRVHPEAARNPLMW